MCRFDRCVESEFVSIGRVITSKRNCGYVKQILEEGIKVAKERFNADKTYIEAQTNAKVFYEKFGFKQISEEFIKDGISHIKNDLVAKIDYLVENEKRDL